MTLVLNLDLATQSYLQLLPFYLGNEDDELF